MSTTPSKPPRAAETRCGERLQERRDQIRAAGLGFGERQHYKFAEAHAKGELIQTLCGAMERYKGTSNEHNLRGMAKAIKRGLPTWEEVLTRQGEPWSRYVTPAARRGAQRSVADATTYVRFL